MNERNPFIYIALCFDVENTFAKRSTSFPKSDMWQTLDSQLG